MTNSIFLFDNQADGGTISASSIAGGTLGANNVINEQRSKIWRSGVGSSSYLNVTLASAFGATHIALIDLNLTTAGTIRIQSWADAIAGSVPGIDITVVPTLYINTDLASVNYGDGPFGIGLYGSNQALSQLNVRNITLIPLPSVTIDPYFRITFTDINTTYQQCGRIYIGSGMSFETNLSYGWTASRQDRTKSREALGGQTYRQSRDSRLQIGGSFDSLTDDERLKVLMRIQEFGKFKSFIYSVFPESTNKGLSSTLYGVFANADVTNSAYQQTKFPFTIIEEL